MKKPIILCTLFSIMLLNINVYTQTFTNTGTTDLLRLQSGKTITGAAGILGPADSLVSRLNPALQGEETIRSVSINYSLINNPEESLPYAGSVLGAGITLPMDYGVITAGLDGLLLNQQADIQGYTGLYGNISKQVYPDMLLGAGITTGFGSGSSQMDWRLAADLGFIYKLGNVAGLRNMRWSAVLREIGKGFNPDGNGLSYPPVFTPALGLGFDYGPERVKGNLSAEIAVPSFQDAELEIRNGLTFFNTAELSVSVKVGARDLIDGAYTASSLPVKGAIGVKFPAYLGFLSGIAGGKKKDYEKSDIRIDGGFSMPSNDMWVESLHLRADLGTYDTDGPTVKIDYKDKSYISPNHDSVKDLLSIPVAITDNSHITECAFIVQNTDSTQVYKKEITLTKDEKKNFWDRLFYVKNGIKTPNQFEWNGKNSNGVLVPDGTYKYFITSEDIHGNKTTTEPQTVHVDTKAPEISIETIPQPVKTFSPNADGQKDTLAIRQSGSMEDKWEYFIYNSKGNTVLSGTFKNDKPENLTWKGQNNEGALVADGVYRYVIRCTDKAGNNTKETVENIIVNTIKTPVKVSLGATYISPNNDGVKDSLDVNIEAPVQYGVSTWSLEIYPENGDPIKTIDGSGELPSSLVINGRTEDGNAFPDGRYYAKLSILYKNGNKPTAETPFFIVDTTAPTAWVKSSFLSFSPNGDGRKDTISFYQETSEEEFWRGTITAADGNTVQTYEWTGRADPKLVWRGVDDDGKLVADGEYSYKITATDKAGNTGSSSPVSFSLSTEETSVFLTIDKTAFSPNGDGIKDTIEIAPQIRVSEGILNYSFAITDAEGNIIKNTKGREIPKQNFIWKGFNNSGEKAPDGTYKAKLQVTYRNGNKPQSESSTFIMDTESPEAAISAEPKLFSPNGDGNKDIIRISQETSSEDKWTGKIINSDEETVYSTHWEGKAFSWKWDGKDNAGNVADNGVYSYVLSTTDKAGNAEKQSISDIIVDNRKTPVFIYADKEGFSPNGDGVGDTITINTMINLEQGIKSWEISFVQSDMGAVKTFSDQGTVPPKTIVWNGKSDKDTIRQGVYSAKLKVIYKKGDISNAETREFVLDNEGPSISLNIGPLPFSPDDDGYNDRLNIDMNVQDISKIKNWEFEIFDPEGNLFYSFNGSTPPKNSIVWDGKSRDGELVQSATDYAYKLTMTDAYRNTTVKEGEIPIDILVIRDGDQLKIAISSITFDSYKSSLVTSVEERTERNRMVIKRLSEILKKYSEYDVIIEGHALRGHTWDEETIKYQEENVLKPLSLNRAKSVRDALIEHGVDPERLKAVGKGGTEPIYPVGDFENAWKNRRVEFILDR